MTPERDPPPARAYSLDLRQKLVGAVDSGPTHQEVADRFDVSTDTVSRYLKRRRETGTLDRRPIPGATPRITREDYPALIAQLAAHPDATLADHCDRWTPAGHPGVSPATMCRTLQRLNWTRKKNGDRERAG